MLQNRYRLPITARDHQQLSSEMMTYMQTAYGARIDEVNEHELLSLQRDWIALVGEAQMRQAERASYGCNLATAIEARHILYISYWAYGYVPSGPKAATYTMTISADAAVGFVIYAGTLVRTAPVDGSEPAYFEVQESAIKPVGASTLTFTVRHGETQTNDFTATGLASQIIEIPGNDAVVTDAVVVTVNGTEWTAVDSFAASTPTDEHYRLVVTEPEPFVRRYHVLFGDGNLGSIPTGGATVTIEALIGGGTEGNVDLGSINTFDEPLLDLSSNPVVHTLVNTAQTQRGSTAEPIDATRYKAPLTTAIHGGVVGKSDYEYAALMKGAARAKAYTRKDSINIPPNVVVVYVAVDTTDPPTTEELDTMLADIEGSYRTNGTAELILLPIEFDDFVLDVDIHLEEDADPTETLASVTTVTNSFFSFDSYIGPVPTPVLDVGKAVQLSNYVYALESVSGVDFVEFPTQSLSAFEPADGRIPRVTVNLAVI